MQLVESCREEGFDKYKAISMAMLAFAYSIIVKNQAVDCGFAVNS